MDNKKTIKEQIRDLLVIPILVGAVTVILTFVLPKIIEKGKQISYEIEGPTAYLDSEMEKINEIEISVNGHNVSNIFLLRLSIINSGDIPLKDIPVRLVFNDDGNDFQILSVNHQTSPQYEFGEINEDYIGSNSLRFTFSLLNPNDEDIITMIVNKNASFDLFSKAEGVKVKEKLQKGWFEKTSYYFAIVATIGSALSMLLSMSLPQIMKRLYKKSRKKDNLEKEK